MSCFSSSTQHARYNCEDNGQLALTAFCLLPCWNCMHILPCPYCKLGHMCWRMSVMLASTWEIEKVRSSGTAWAREFEVSLVYRVFLSETETVRVRLCLYSLSYILKCSFLKKCQQSDKQDMGSSHLCLAWPVNLLLRRLNQEGCKFRASEAA